MLYHSWLIYICRSIPAVSTRSCICVCRVSLPDLLPPMSPTEIMVIRKTRVIIYYYYYYHINRHITICVHSFFLSFLFLPSLTRSLSVFSLFRRHLHTHSYLCLFVRCESGVHSRVGNNKTTVDDGESQSIFMNIHLVGKKHRRRGSNIM